MSIERVIHTALNKNPSLRFSSQANLRQAFEHARVKEPRNSLYASTAVHQPDITHSPTLRPKLNKPSDHIRPKVNQRYRGLHLFRRSGQRAGRMTYLPVIKLTLGRSSIIQLQLREQSVSRHHAPLFNSKNRLVIEVENCSYRNFIYGTK